MGYRIGIIGCGSVAQHHLRGYRHLSHVEVVAVADPNEKALENAEKKWGIKNLYMDYNNLLRRNDIDIVDITVPDPLHAKISIDATNANKHVICEKPFVQSIEEAETILATVRKRGVKFMVNQNFRWFPKYEGIKKILDKDLIGKVLALHLDLFTWRSYAQPWWKKQEKLLIYKQLIHEIDLFHWWLKKDPHRVFAVANNSSTQPEFKGDTMAMITLDYGNDCYGQINGCWYSRDTFIFDEFRIIGTTGGIEFSGFASPFWEEYSSAKTGKLKVISEKLGDHYLPEVKKPPCDDYAWTFAVSLNELIKAIKNDQEPVVSIEDNLKVLRTVFACYESAKIGESVKVK